MSIGLTFDTGALIALSNRRLNMMKVLNTAREDKIPITVPAVVIAEWWRARSNWNEEILRSVTVEPTSSELAKAAGEALATLSGRVKAPPGAPNALTIDAIVMASAGQRGDIVYTQDPVDLLLFTEVFKAVKRIEKA